MKTFKQFKKESLKRPGVKFAMQTTQEKITEYLKKRAWDKNEPVDLAKSIMIEGAELLELFQWGNKNRKQVMSDSEFIKNLKGELADIFIYSYGMTISLGLNADDLIQEKLNLVEKKYPPRIMSREEHLKIKREFRKKNK
jgi:dCTP diphosphatase